MAPDLKVKPPVPRTKHNPTTMLSRAKSLHSSSNDLLVRTQLREANKLLSGLPEGNDDEKSPGYCRCHTYTPDERRGSVSVKLELLALAKRVFLNPETKAPRELGIMSPTKYEEDAAGRYVTLYQNTLYDAGSLQVLLEGEWVNSEVLAMRSLFNLCQTCEQSWPMSAESGKVQAGGFWALDFVDFVGMCSACGKPRSREAQKALLKSREKRTD